MFQTFNSEVVGFPSRWKTERSTQETECQTDNLDTKHVSISTEPRKDFQVQTDEESYKRCSTPPGLLESLNNNLLPKILDELDIVSAYSYDHESIKSEDEKEISITTVQTLQSSDHFLSPSSPAILQNEDKDDNYSVSTISWSSDGRKLAVGYGNFYHDEWCQHDTCLNIYSKNSRDGLLKFSNNLKFSSCITNAVFHHSKESILAVATVTGTISVYNFEFDENDKKFSIDNKNTGFMIKSISQIMWLTREQISKYLSNSSEISLEYIILVSAGMNGEIIFWKINLHLFTFTKHQCFRVQIFNQHKINFSPDINRIDFMNLWNNSTELKNPLNFDRNIFDDNFAIGTRTGDLFICRSLSVTTIDEIYSEPQVEKFSSHKGCVLSLSFSKKDGTQLISLGGDMEIKIFIISQNNPIHVIYLENELSEIARLPNFPDTLLGISSSDKKRKSFQCWDISNNFEVINFKQNEIRDSAIGDSMVRLTINPNKFKEIACGTTNGKVIRYNISWNE